MLEEKILSILGSHDRLRWNQLVKSFDNWDVYYLFEYANSVKIHEGGEIYLVYFSNDNDRLCFVVLQQDLSTLEFFKNIISKDKLYDWSTPYGYGGPLVNHKFSENSDALFIQEVSVFCLKNNIVSLFVRFHPLMNNFESVHNLFETKYLRDTVYIDTSVSPDVIMKNMMGNCRRNIRRAQLSGITIEYRTAEAYEDFLPMYYETMRRHCADSYYMFSSEYFEELSQLKDNACFFYALYENKPICGALILFNSEYAHYHLGATFDKYRGLYPTNMLFYSISCWANKNGIKKFHLGGGLTPNDSLYRFKSHFNKNGSIPFGVGRVIFDRNQYERLLCIRKELNRDFDENNNFMIQYRWDNDENSDYSRSRGKS